MEEFKFLQGSEIKIQCKGENATLVISNGIEKYMTTAVEQIEDKYYVKFTSEETKDFAPVRYAFQIITDNTLELQGTLRIAPNLLYSNALESYWKTVLNAVEQRIAGKALDGAAASVSVDGKSISYLSLSELFKLRDFCLQKIAEEEGDEAAESPNNEKKILFVWR